jgi:hypothetical protein
MLNKKAAATKEVDFNAISFLPNMLRPKPLNKNPINGKSTIKPAINFMRI